MTNKEQVRLVNEYVNQGTLFGKDVQALSDEELDSIPVAVRKILIKETLKTLKD